MNEHMLKWPLEAALEQAPEFRWSHGSSNLCLDFHGDPVAARLVVFSDGNHHMALADSLRAFVAEYPDVRDVFYATTPPGVLINALDHGGLRLGNLFLGRRPHLFIGPVEIIAQLVEKGTVVRSDAFMRSRGNALLVRRDNPLEIRGVADLMRPEVRLFMSNPGTEKASFDVYTRSLLQLAQRADLDPAPLAARFEPNAPGTYFGERIHHREAPHALASDHADVAMVYYHLALRYRRIFPDLFDFVLLGPDVEDPSAAGMVYTSYQIGLVDADDPVALMAHDFLRSETVAKIYEHHGLARA